MGKKEVMLFSFSYRKHGASILVLLEVKKKKKENTSLIVSFIVCRSRGERDF